MTWQRGGKRALVTGGEGGLGEGTAKVPTDEGATVAAHALGEQETGRVGRQILTVGANAFGLPAEPGGPLPTRPEGSPSADVEPVRRSPTGLPSRGVVAAIDEFFGRQPITALRHRVAEGVEDSRTGQPTPEEIRYPDPDEVEHPPSPLRDYVRELKQEFDEQEEQGKIY